jgi:hypothetical protein
MRRSGWLVFCLCLNAGWLTAGQPIEISGRYPHLAVFTYH